MSRQLVHNISDSKKINKNGKQRKNNVRITKKSNAKKSNTKKSNTKKKNDTNSCQEYNNKYLYLYLTLFLISGTLYYFGLTLPDITMKFFAGLTLTLTGITLITIGYPTLTDTLLKDGFSVVTMGVGLYMMISIGMKWIKEGGL